jgi:hypothetical protein
MSSNGHGRLRRPWKFRLAAFPEGVSRPSFVNTVRPLFGLRVAQSLAGGVIQLRHTRLESGEASTLLFMEDVAAKFEAAWVVFARTCADAVAPEATFQDWFARPRSDKRLVAIPHHTSVRTMMFPMPVAGP